MTTRTAHRRVAVLVAGCVSVAACSVDQGVTRRLSEPSPLESTSPAETTSTGVATDEGDDDGPVPPGSSVPGIVQPTIAFGSCDDFVPGFDDPPAGSWECGRVSVPMDPAGSTGDTVGLAVTRLVGARSRGQALLVNPGGPGAPGLPFIWSIADAFPADLLRNFDIVSWDPRGVGMSTPAVDCPRGSRWSDLDLMESCADATGPLMRHLTTPNHVADLEALRVALGQDQLDYLGYSYGTYLGALYAGAHPRSVGHFVLDGATDPGGGTSASPTVDGEAWYADDGVDIVTDRFFELCDATEFCDLGPASAAAYADLVTGIAGLPTERFPGLDVVDPFMLDLVFDTAMYDPYNWGLIATALEDGLDGDASTLDALADVYAVTDEYFNDLVDLRFSNEEIARLAIYCADFQNHRRSAVWCDGTPANSLPAVAIDPVDVKTPLLVIGTRFDPATPLHHAERLRDALGEADLMIWNGVGHTAFPRNSFCVDEAVVGYLLDGFRWPSGDECDAVDSGDDAAVVADYLFGLPPVYVEGLMSDAFATRRASEPDCLARALADSGDRIVTHVILDVDSEARRLAQDAAEVSCSVG